MERREKVEQVKERERIRIETFKKWTRREENEFLRVLTGYGIDLQQSTPLPTPDWTKFKAMAKLDKKSDENLSDYYKVFIAMCKRQAAVKLTEEERGLEGIIDDISEDHARLVLDRLELLSKLREVVKNVRMEERLGLCQNNFDTPDWWISGRHDRELIRAVLKHGLYKSEYNIFNDPEFTFLKSERQFREDIETQYLKIQQLETAEAAAAAAMAATAAENLDTKERIIKLEKIDSTLQIEKIIKKEKDDLIVNNITTTTGSSHEKKSEVDIILDHDGVKIEDGIAESLVTPLKEINDESINESGENTKEESINEKTITNNDVKSTVDITVDKEKVTKDDDKVVETLEDKDNVKEKLDDKIETIGDDKIEVIVEDKIKSNEMLVEEETGDNKDNIKLKEEEEEEIPEGKGDPDDDEVMKEKEKAVEEECKKQAAELKARFPDLEVIQPLVKVKSVDVLKENKGIFFE